MPDQTRRGWTLEGIDDHGVPRLLDVHIRDQWTTRGRQCVLLEIARFFIMNYRNPLNDRVLEEHETVYQGGVYVPELDAVYGGYSGVRPSRIDDETDWTWTSAADDLKKPGIGYDTLAEAVRAQTDKLARSIALTHKEALEG